MVQNEFTKSTAKALTKLKIENLKSEQPEANLADGCKEESKFGAGKQPGDIKHKIKLFAKATLND